MSNIYKQGDNRKQQMFFPPSIDEYVSQDNQVRAIDDYVEMLDTAKLGFTNASLNSADGRPAYHPKLLLKIYIYGYLNKIRSSRKLEQEIDRNIEMMWLCTGLKPRYRTIADFRKDNSAPLKRVFREFVLLCKELTLIGGELIAIDGAFLRANASKNQLITKKTVVKDLEKIDNKIEAYLKALNFADKEEKRDKALKPLPTNNLPKMKKRKTKLDQDLTLLEEMGVTQYNRTDPDAKLMVKPAHNLMAYNAQIAVDKKYKFIVATDISTKGSDLDQLHNMASKAKDICTNDKMVIVADTGYYSSKEFKKCTDDNIEVIVPLANTSQAQKDKGFFIRDLFVYDKTKDLYICPNQQQLTKRSSVVKNEKLLYAYRAGSAICKACPVKDKCIPDQTAHKTIFRWEYEEIIEAHVKKMKTAKAKAIVKQRGSLAEHPFGSIKQTLGWSHFLVRGKEKVSGENTLIMFTYNFKRMLNLIGIALFRKLIIALQEGNIDTIREEIVAYIALLWHICMNNMLKSWKILFQRKALSF
ncbi:MAG: IS1182 family transposase [Campylobacterota bacterium]|nr:IS1182 family transposase [Campylobacterota bacterium]